MSIDSNGRITMTNVSIEDVKTALSAGSYDLGTLCKHTNINKWARYKPVKHTKVSELTENDLKAADVTFGLTARQANSMSALASLYNGTDNGWVYVRPSGGDASPYRLTDFAGYDKNAKFEIDGCTIRPLTLSAGSDTIGVTLAHASYTGFNIKLSEVATIENCYLGIYVTGGSMSRWITTTKTVKQMYDTNDHQQAQISTSGMTAGTYTAYPFLSEQRMSENQNVSGNLYYTIPNCEKETITIQEAGSGDPFIRITPNTITFNNFRFSATFVYNSIGTTGSSWTGWIDWAIRLNNKKWDDPITSEESSGRIDNVTVTGSNGVGSYTINGQRFQNIDPRNLSDYTMYIQFSRGLYENYLDSIQLSDIYYNDTV